MRRFAPLPALLLLLLPASAGADMLGLGEKSVKLSIHVDAEVPSGKALVLVNTFRGADLITPGVTQPVEWHPLGGEMQLRLVDADRLKKLAALREDIDRDAIRPLVTGVDCHSPFSGVRTIPEISPTAEIRWTYRVAVTDGKCTADLVRTEQLDARGGVVPTTDLNTSIRPPTLPPVPAEPPAPAKPAEPAKAPEPAKPPEPAKTPTAGCGGCVATDEPVGALALLALLGLRSRRRR